MEAEREQKTDVENLQKIGKLLSKKVEDGKEEQNKCEQPKKSEKVILHYSEFKSRWDWIVLALTYYTSIVVPFAAAFGVKGGNKMWTMLDSFVDIFFLADVIINFHTTHAGTEGQIVTDLRLIRMRYIKTWFLVDMTSCLPYDAVTLLVTDTQRTNVAHLLSILKSLRLLRLFRIARDMEKYTEHAYASLIVMMSLILLLCHWMGCGWYNVGLIEAEKYVKSVHAIKRLQENDNAETNFTKIKEQNEKNEILTSDFVQGNNEILSNIYPEQGQTRRDVGKKGTIAKEMIFKKGEVSQVPPGNPFPPNWLIRLSEQTRQEFYWDDEMGKMGGGPNIRSAYCSCLYFTMTAVISQGFGNIGGDTNNEKLYCIFILTVGCLLYAAILANVTSTMENINARKEEFNEITKSIVSFCKLHRVPEHLKDAMLDYVSFTWIATHGISVKKVLDYLPEHMKLDASIYLHKSVMTTQMAFKDLSETSARHLASKMERLHIAPGDMLIDSGEEVQVMNFIIYGSIEIIQEGQIIGILSKGDIFGTEFWNPEVKRRGIAISQSAAKALTYVDLEVITGQDIIHAMKIYPDIQRTFFRKVKLTYDLTKQIPFTTVKAIHWMKEVEENPEVAKKDKRLKKWINKCRKRKSEKNQSEEMKKIKVDNSEQSLKRKENRLENTSSCATKRNDAKCDPLDSSKEQFFVSNVRHPERIRVRNDDIIKLSPMTSYSNNDNEACNNPYILPDDITVKASIYEINSKRDAEEVMVRQLADVNFSLECGDWMEMELPMEIKEILRSTLKLKIRATHKLTKIRERLDLCEKHIINIADMAQQLYG